MHKCITSEARNEGSRRNCPTALSAYNAFSHGSSQTCESWLGNILRFGNTLPMIAGLLMFGVLAGCFR